MATRKAKLIMVLTLLMLLTGVLPVWTQANKVFTGKITEIATGTELNVGRKETFYIVRLDEYVNLQFRLTPEDAGRYGLVEKAGPTGVLTPRMSKGIGWKVKLTCDPKYIGSLKTPTYRVLSLTRLGD